MQAVPLLSGREVLSGNPGACKMLFLQKSGTPALSTMGVFLECRATPQHLAHAP